MVPAFSQGCTTLTMVFNFFYLFLKDRTESLVGRNVVPQTLSKESNLPIYSVWLLELTAAQTLLIFMLKSFANREKWADITYTKRKFKI
jgi:hypothetical protein